MMHFPRITVSNLSPGNADIVRPVDAQTPLRTELLAGIGNRRGLYENAIDADKPEPPSAIESFLPRFLNNDIAYEYYL